MLLIYRGKPIFALSFLLMKLLSLNETAEEYIPQPF